MTAWQDLPPRTRRQARMNERGAQPDAEFERAQAATGQGSAGLTFHEAGTRPEAETAYSRRARRVREQSEPGPASMPDEAGFRVRDFRPEATVHPHAAFQTTAAAPDAQRPGEPGHAEPTRQLPQWAPPGVDHEGDLPYFTQAAPLFPPQPAPQPALVNSVPAEFAAPPRPLTRRQLRELETDQGTRPQADDAPPAPIVPPAPPSAAREAVVLPAAPEAYPSAPPVVRLEPPIAVPAPAPVAPAPPAEAPPSLVSPEPVVFTDASGAAPSGRAAAPVPVAPSAATAPNADGIAGPRGIDFAPEVYSSPTEQWSAPARGDADQPGAGFIRTIGTHTGILTTSALVMPSVPQASDIIRPLSSTGEILVTGSIDLPHTLGTTGAHPARFDHSDIDALFAAEDHDFAPTDSAPVRAIRAVSTHTSTHGVISAKKPASNRLPMMMAVTAGILAVGVAALFAAAMVFGYF